MTSDGESNIQSFLEKVLDSRGIL